MNWNTKFKIFASNRIVSGPTRSLVVDTNRQSMQLIPNSLASLVLRYDGKETIADILEKYEPADQETIKEYFTFLLDKEIIFLTNSPGQFPDLDLSWDYPAHISNAIIEFNPELLNNYKELVSELDQLLCNYLELRIFTPCKLQELNSFLSLFKESTILSMQIIMNEIADWKIEDYQKLLDEFPRIDGFAIYNSSHETNAEENPKLVFFKSPVGNHSCGAVSNTFFVANVQAFTEALQFNTCLNRKVGIDGEGNIKNCPSLMQSYGNIKEQKLGDITARADFQKVWSVNKDKINICRDCEFRYVCTDCRAFVEDPADDFSKPLKCGYDPYTGQWSEWSENPLKQKAIESYGLQNIALTNSST